MSSEFDTFMSELCRREALIVAEGGSTPIGADHVFAIGPKPDANNPLTFPCVINRLEKEAPELAQDYQGAIQTVYPLMVVILLAEVNEKVQDIESLTRSYIHPLRKTLRPFMDNQFRNPSGELTCTGSQLNGWGWGVFPYHNGLYHSVGCKLLVEIWEDFN